MPSDPTPVHTVRCPTCGKPVSWRRESRWRPFCSERCRLIDLGEWLSDEDESPEDGSAPSSRHGF